MTFTVLQQYSPKQTNTMPNTYTWTRMDPLVKTEDVGGSPQKVVETLVAGMTAQSDDGYSAYIDSAISTPLDPDNFIPFDDLPESWAVDKANSVADERGWKDALDKQIEAAKARPLPAKFPWQQAEEAPSE